MFVRYRKEEAPSYMHLLMWVGSACLAILHKSKRKKLREGPKERERRERAKRGGERTNEREHGGGSVRFFFFSFFPFCPRAPPYLAALLTA
jgi:hypothetical protein